MMTFIGVPTPSDCGHYCLNSFKLCFVHFIYLCMAVKTRHLHIVMNHKKGHSFTYCKTINGMEPCGTPHVKSLRLEYSSTITLHDE